jgi:hypothetical protein
VVKIEGEPRLVYEVSRSRLGLVSGWDKGTPDISRIEVFALAMALLAHKETLCVLACSPPRGRC